MKPFIKSALLALIVVTQGCATYGRISGTPLADQKAVFKDGRQTLISVKQNTVAIAPEAEIVRSGQRGNFVIAVKNGTNHDIVFSTDDVTAHSKTNVQVTVLKVYSYDELATEEKERQRREAVATALQQIGDSLNAPRDRHVRKAARADFEERFARLRAEGEANLSNLSARILKKETIFPGAWHGGIVKIDLPNVSEVPQQIELAVNVGGEIHEFRFIQEKVENK